jgi:hypothetical protein
MISIRNFQFSVFFNTFRVPTLESNQIETWWSNREYSGNFDSKMFLIEQPGYRLPFLTHFIASQMFVSFIDLKIISLIDPRKSPDPNVKVNNIAAQIF